MAKPSSPLLVDDVVLVKKNRKKTGQQDEYDEQPSPSSSSPGSTFNTKSAVIATPAAAVDALQEAPPPPPLPLPTALSRLSRFLKWYTTFMSSSGNQEIGLKILQYSLKLVAIVAGSHTVRRRLDNNSNSNSRLQQVQRLAAFCSKLSNDLSFARYMTRLFGLPAAMEAALHGSWASDSTISKSSYSLQSQEDDDNDKRQMDRHERLDDLLGKILAYSMVAYYPAEHVAFVHWMAPPMPAPPANDDSTLSAAVGHKNQQPLPRTAEKWSAWSCRCWSVYILAEVVQCLLQWRKQRHEQQRLLDVLQQQQQQQGVDDSNTTTTTIMVATKLHETNRVLRNVKLQLVRNALFILPTIHWSLPNWDTDPWLSSPVVNTLMWLETLVHLYKVTT